MLVVLMFITAFAELFTLGAVVPFLVALSAPEKVAEIGALSDFANWFQLDTSINLVTAMTMLFGLAVVISAGARIILLVAQTRVIYQIGAELGVKMYQQVLLQPLSYHTHTSSSELISGITTKANEIIVSFLYPLTLIIGGATILGIVCTAVFVVEPLLSIFTMGTIAVTYLLIGVLVRSSLSSHSDKVARLYEVQVKSAQEGLGGIRDIILNGSQTFFVGRYANAERVLRKTLSQIQISRGLPRFLIEAVGMLLIACVAYVYVYYGNNIQTIMPMLGALALATQRMAPVIQQLFSSWAAIVAGYASVNDAIKLCELKQPSYWTGFKHEPLSFQKHIVLRDACFSHPRSGTVINNVTMRINAGDRVGILGETGSGKSTLLDILMGLLPLESGELLVDDKPINEQNLLAWQQNISQVPQTIYMADISIAENVAFGENENAINLYRMMAAVQGAQLSQLIENWPEQYKTKVGEQGARLSGGQRQRIGIARALYRGAKLIVLDEATSSLDNKMEKQVMDAVDALPDNTTVIMVAHRTSTLKKCNKIFRVSDGKVELVGDYKQFLSIGK